MYAWEQWSRIDSTIARTHGKPVLRIQLLSFESQNCEQECYRISSEISTKKMEYDFLVTRTRAEGMHWEVRGPILEDMAQKHEDGMAELNGELADFEEAKRVADTHIRRARRTRNQA